MSTCDPEDQHASKSTSTIVQNTGSDELQIDQEVDTIFQGGSSVEIKDQEGSSLV